MSATETIARAAERARLHPLESAATFRAVLDAMAHPGLVVRLPAGVRDRVPPVLLPLLMLADVDVDIEVLCDDPADQHTWREAAAVATGAKITDLSSARLVAALDPPSTQVFEHLRRGTALEPELGALVSVPCERITTTDATSIAFDSSATATRAGDVVLRLTGPGVDGARTVVLHGIGDGVVDGIRRTRHRFPAGVDVVVVATDGSMIALPRTTRIDTTPAAPTRPASTSAGTPADPRGAH